MAFPPSMKNLDPDNDGGAPDTPALERAQAKGAKSKKGKKSARADMLARFAKKK